MNKKLRNHLGSSWYEILEGVFADEKIKALQKFVNERRKAFNSKVYPAKEDVFKALRYCPFNDVRVVILGQDPFHTPGVAHGLAFSSMDPLVTPPSLQTVFQEIENSLYDGLKLSQNPDLTRWANQGVLLLNTILTVEKGQPLSHAGKGWEDFTGMIISLLLDDPEPKVFMLWGKKAQASFDAVCPIKKDYTPHLVLRAPHPASESYTPGSGFIGSNCFKEANEFLKTNHEYEIIW